MDERRPLHEFIKLSWLCVVHNNNKALHLGIKQSIYIELFDIDPRVALIYVDMGI